MAKRPTEDEGAPLPASPDEREAGDFRSRLKTARKQAGLEPEPASPPPPLGLASYAFRLATELVAGVIVGGAVGWAIDRAAHTSPFGFVICLLLGFLGGMVNVVRAVRRMNAQAAAAAPPAAVAESRDDEDEDE